MNRHQFEPGDWVVYRKTKFSAKPGPRAENISPSPAGEEYAYQVDKYWVVEEIRENGRLVLSTRRGKLHEVSPEDPNLRRPTLWERLWRRDRFHDPAAVA